MWFEQQGDCEYERKQASIRVVCISGKCDVDVLVSYTLRRRDVISEEGTTKREDDSREDIFFVEISITPAMYTRTERWAKGKPKPGSNSTACAVE